MIRENSFHESTEDWWELDVFFLVFYPLVGNKMDLPFKIGSPPFLAIFIKKEGTYPYLTRIIGFVYDWLSCTMVKK
jgi:hypothetical protein